MTRRVDPFVPPSPLDETENDILVLIDTAKKRGYVTYEELNTGEPEEAPCPAMTDAASRLGRGTRLVARDAVVGHRRCLAGALPPLSCACSLFAAEDVVRQLCF